MIMVFWWAVQGAKIRREGISKRRDCQYVSTPTTMLKRLRREFNLPLKRICNIATYHYGSIVIVSFLTSSQHRHRFNQCRRPMLPEYSVNHEQSIYQDMSCNQGRPQVQSMKKWLVHILLKSSQSKSCKIPVSFAFGVTAQWQGISREHFTS